MATKICKNGHKYDADIYGDNCPCCPSSGEQNYDKTQSVAAAYGTTAINDSDEHTKIILEDIESRTIIKHSADIKSEVKGGRRLVGLLVSYDPSPLGEVYKIMEGRNIIGRDSKKCDIVITNDNNISSTHLLILYREVEDKFWATDQDSSNGTYVNDVFEGERVELRDKDVIKLGDSKFIFLAIPKIQ